MTRAPSHNGRAAGPATVSIRSSYEWTDTGRRRHSPGRRRRATARRRRRLRGLVRLIVLVLVIVFAIWVSARVANATSDHGVYSERTYVVARGDTLWSIAERWFPGDRDPREVVFEIERRNGLRDASLSPGTTLVLPPAGE